MSGEKVKWISRSLVALTILMVLGGGYVGQVWWAKQWAERMAHRHASLHMYFDPEDADLLVYRMKRTPWYGQIDQGWTQREGAWKVWVPRRTYFEYARIAVGQNLGSDPAAWEAWFKAHPDLVWDSKQKRLVDPKEIRP